MKPRRLFHSIIERTGPISGHVLRTFTIFFAMFALTLYVQSDVRAVTPLDDFSTPISSSPVSAFRPTTKFSDHPLFSPLGTENVRGQMEQGTLSEWGDDTVWEEETAIDSVPSVSMMTGDLSEHPVYYFHPSDNVALNPDAVFDPTVLSGESDASSYDPWTGESEESPWEAQLLPVGLIYPSYLAGRKEPRLASIFTHDDDYGWLWDITLGGRVPLFRFGTTDPIEPEGFQIDMEGAALLRLDFERDRELAGTDYRAGLPITYGTKHWQYKFGYYHVSSHLGDQYLLANFKKRVHYVRDELIFGLAYKPISAVRLYAEAGWAFNAGETTSPWEFQFGAEYSPVYHPLHPWRGAPFAAVCGHLFEELDFGGYFNSQIGWQWRGPTNARLRLGAEFYCGCDDQFQFHCVYQRKVGFGLWYDF